MKVYFCYFVNSEQNNWARLLSMAKFAYNNSKNASIGYTLFELNCGYHSWVFFKNKCNAYSRSCTANRLAIKLKKVIDIWRQNLLHAQNL